MTEIRVTDEDGTTLRREDVTPPGHALPGGTTPATALEGNATVGAAVVRDDAMPARPVGEVDDTGEARARIEQTRARMSGTIDQIESALLRKKEEIQDRLDVLAPVREHPLPAVAAVFGAGLLLGLITGGDDDDDDLETVRVVGDDREWEDRAEAWESRSHELERIVERQRREIAHLRGELHDEQGSTGRKVMGAAAAAAPAVAAMTGSDDDHPDHETAGMLGDALESLKESIAHGVGQLVSSAFQQLREGSERAA